MYYLTVESSEVKTFRAELFDKQIFVICKMLKYAWIQVPYIAKDIHGRYIRIFYYIGYSGSKRFDVGVVVACYSGNMGIVPAKLSFIILFVYFLFFSLFGVLLIRELLIKLLAVLSKICKFLAFIAFVVINGFLFIRVFSLKHHCKVFC